MIGRCLHISLLLFMAHTFMKGLGMTTIDRISENITVCVGSDVVINETYPSSQGILRHLNLTRVTSRSPKEELLLKISGNDVMILPSMERLQIEPYSNGVVIKNVTLADSGFYTTSARVDLQNGSNIFLTNGAFVTVLNYTDCNFPRPMRATFTLITDYADIEDVLPSSTAESPQGAAREKPFIGILVVIILPLGVMLVILSIIIVYIFYIWFRKTVKHTIHRHKREQACGESCYPTERFHFDKTCERCCPRLTFRHNEDPGISYVIEPSDDARVELMDVTRTDSVVNLNNEKCVKPKDIDTWHKKEKGGDVYEPALNSLHPGGGEIASSLPSEPLDIMDGGHHDDNVNDSTQAAEPLLHIYKPENVEHVDSQEQEFSSLTSVASSLRNAIDDIIYRNGTKRTSWAKSRTEFIEALAKSEITESDV